ncbi:hypothetical protein ABK040_004649 [Willaertia magna]
MKVLVVDKGIGFEKAKYLSTLNNKDYSLTKYSSKLNTDHKENGVFEIKIITVPEPTSSGINYEENEEFQQGIVTILNEIDNFKPNIIIASSRGGKYICEIIKTKGDTLIDKNIVYLLLSSMLLPGVDFNLSKVVFVYGSEEKTVPQQMINNLKPFSDNGNCLLLQYKEQGHDLSVLTSSLDIDEDKIDNYCQNILLHQPLENNVTFNLIELIIFSFLFEKLVKLPEKKITNNKSQFLLSPSLLQNQFGALKKRQ